MSKLRIGIVGCGAIGSSLAKTIVKDFAKEAVLAGLYDIDNRKTRALNKAISKRNNIVCLRLQQLISKSDLVIEAAAASASYKIARQALLKGRDIMVMSVGGLLGRLERLRSLAKANQANIYIPSGALSGIDALKAAGLFRMKSVTLITSKHPKAFKGVKYLEKVDLSKIKKDKVLFFGSAKEAVKKFPQNINVAAILSLAGLGEDKTQVKIIASPEVKRNIHEVRIEARAATIVTRTENILHPDNPKTSFLAFLSAVATLKQILNPVKIGT